MSGFLPGKKPNVSKEQTLNLINAMGVDLKKYPCVLVGVRGFYPAMGLEDVNDRQMYDDAFIFYSPSIFATFNGNVDPNGYRYGYGTGSRKGMASLKTGVWHYQKGLHKGYPAFIQADKVTVIRDGKDADYEDTGFFGINIHRGGETSTSSLGCQTVPTSQWGTFRSLIYAELERHNQAIFPYVLIDGNEQNLSNVGHPTLKQGDTGRDVKRLQFYLMDLDLPVLPKVIADGDFGPVTHAHVREFQTMNGLTVDGIVGPRTWDLLIKTFNFNNAELLS